MTTISPSFDKSTPVYIAACDAYEKTRVTEAVDKAFAALGITAEMLSGKRVAIKPNLVMKKGAEAAATTHPAVLDALLTYLDGCGCADVVIAESPGGPYTESALRASYRVCGLEDAAKGHNVRFNVDLTARELNAPDGVTAKSFHIITPIADADVIINLCKLKSHSLTRMSGAIKNTFGTIPGLEKFEMHARFSDYTDFNSMLVDLSAMLHARATVIDLCDAIVGMEGNGPTGGNPRKIGALLCSQNPFSLDCIASEMLACRGEVPMLDEAAKRGYCHSEPSDIITLGDDYKALILSDFVAPDTAARSASALTWLPKLFGGSVYRWFSPHPVIRSKTCIGCGECVRSCPVHTITLEHLKNGKKRAVIHDRDCIRCFCCQELCPIHSVDIHRNPILDLLGSLRR